MSGRRVLITGMSGLIGGIVRRDIEGEYELRALNRGNMPDVECFQADIADLNAMQPAFEGVDTVVHLAAAHGYDATWEDILNFNLIGGYNVYEASRLAGVKRIIFASTGLVGESGVVVTDHETGYPYHLISDGRYDEAPKPWPMVTHETPIRPLNEYACSKAWGEALGRFYSDRYSISVICLRIGAVTDDDRPKTPRQWPAWCSHRDLAQIIRKSLEAPESVRYDIFYAVSNNKWGFRDIQHARDVLGYDPQDDAGDYRP